LFLTSFWPYDVSPWSGNLNFVFYFFLKPFDVAFGFSDWWDKSKGAWNAAGEAIQKWFWSGFEREKRRDPIFVLRRPIFPTKECFSKFFHSAKWRDLIFIHLLPFFLTEEVDKNWALLYWSINFKTLFTMVGLLIEKRLGFFNYIVCFLWLFMCSWKQFRSTSEVVLKGRNF